MEQEPHLSEDLLQLHAVLHTACPVGRGKAEAAGLVVITALCYWWQLMEVTAQHELQPTKGCF